VQCHCRDILSSLTKLDTAVGRTFTSLVGWIPMMAFIGWLWWSGRLPVVKEDDFK
jgi:hypothetical protein